MINKIAQLLLVFFLFFGSVIETSAQISGGSLTYTCNTSSSNTYDFTLTLYQYCRSGTGTSNTSLNPIIPSINFLLKNDCGINNFTAPDFILSGTEDISQLCSSETSSCSGGSQPGLLKYTYNATITFPASCNWKISFEGGSRDASSNITGGTTNMYLQSEIFASGTCNSSPIVTNQSIPSFCAGQDNSFCLNAIDPDFNFVYGFYDNEFIRYSMVKPLGSTGTPLAYETGYTYLSPLSNFSINPITGCLNFNEPNPGRYVVTILIESIRHFFGSPPVITNRVVQEYYFEVVNNCSNTPPITAGLLNFSGTGNAQILGSSISMFEGDNISFDVVFTDNNVSDVLTLISDVTTVLPGATFSTQPGTTPNSITGTINWTAPIGSTGGRVHFTADDDVCPFPGIAYMDVVVGVVDPILTITGPSGYWCPGVGSIPLTGIIAENIPPGGITYSWTGPNNQTSSTNTINVTEPGSYTLTITLPDGYTEYQTVIVGYSNDVPTPDYIILGTPTVATFTVTRNESCTGSNDGEANIIIPSGSQILADGYTVNGGATIYHSSPYTITGLSAGTHTVTIANALNPQCTKVLNIPIASTELIVTVSSIGNVHCVGSNDGIAILDFSTNTQLLTDGYTVNGGTNINYSPQYTLTGLSAGTHIVTITNALHPMCNVQKTISILNLGPIINNVITVASSCDIDNGSATVTASAVSGSGFSYAWYMVGNFPGTPIPGETSATISNLAPGSYVVVVTSINDPRCFVFQTFDIDQGTNSNYILTATPGNCGNYSFSYNPVAGAPIIINPQISFGDGTFTPLGTTINPGTVINHIYPSSGNYAVTLTGDNITGCIVATTVNITLPLTDFTYDLNAGGGICDNVVDFTISNYDPTNYTYIWDFGTFTQAATAATTTYTFPTSGSHIVALKITNAQLCSQTTSKPMVVGSVPATFTTQNVCAGTQMQVTGLTQGADSYNWTMSGPVSANFSGLNPYHIFNTPGTYTLSLTVLSQGGTCSNTYQQSIVVNALPDPTFTATVGSCGLVNIALDNSTTFTSYKINYADGPVITGTASSISTAHASHTYTANGTYSISVTLYNGVNGVCERTITHTVSITDLPTVYVNNSSPYLCANSSVTLNAIVNNLTGSGSVTYNWVATSAPGTSLGSNSQLVVSTGGTYQVIVTYNGCVAVSSPITIQNLVELVAAHNTITPTSCSGIPDGAANITITTALFNQGCLVNGTLLNAINTTNSGGIYTYHITGLTGGDNYITIASALDPTCNSVLIIPVPSNGPIINISSITPSDCNGNTGAINASVTNGTGEWFALVNYPNGPALSSTTGLTPGDYVIVATNTNGCVITQTINVPSNTFSLAILNTSLEVCMPNGTIDIEIDDFETGAGLDWYKKDAFGVWQIINPSSNGTSPAGNQLYQVTTGIGNYQVVGTSNGCTYTLPFTLIPTNIQIALTQIGGYCSGQDVVINAQIAGGNGTYTLDWSEPGLAPTDYTSATANGNNYSIVGLIKNDLRVTLDVEDGQGCTATKFIDIVIFTSHIDMVNCSDNNDIFEPFSLTNLTIINDINGDLDVDATIAASSGVDIHEIFVTNNCDVVLCGTDGTNTSSGYAYEWFTPNVDVEQQQTVAFINGDATSGTAPTPVSAPTELTYNNPYNSNTATLISTTSTGVATSPEYAAAIVAYDDQTIIPKQPVAFTYHNPSLGVNEVDYPYYEYNGASPYFALTSQAVLPATIPEPYDITVMVTMPDQSILVHGHTGVTESANFLLGSHIYEVYISDANGCRNGPYAILLTVTQALHHPEINFVWAKPTNQNNEPDPVIVDINLKDNMAEAANSLLSNAAKCMQTQAADMAASFKADCFDISTFKDEFALRYNVNEYHYTLYYYDRAGQLTKTVPPAGVDYLTGADGTGTPGEIESLIAFRDGGAAPSVYVPTHNMETKYQYNGLGQLISQETPDGGVTNFIYDGLNRLRFSQNAEQEVNNTYSYTKYDDLGRIVEVGESTLLTDGTYNLDFTSQVVPDNTLLADAVLFPATGNTQITKTVYSNPLVTVSYYGLSQRYLQNRVSYVYNDQDGDLATLDDQNHTYYSYDPHGNVEWLIQEVAGLGQNYIKYEYDLISGNVLKVSYNEQRKDRFFHKYSYDAENRLQVVETSRDGLIWDKDANYQYYAHGPLQRTVLGEDHVQGLDYLYTIHGWLKSINTPSLSSNGIVGTNTKDKDGKLLAAGTTHNEVAQDRFGMSLGYYSGDYSNIKTYHNDVSELNGSSLYASNGNAGNDLFNGNITQWVHSQLGGTGQTPIEARASIYQYDVLNRIKASKNQNETAAGSGIWEKTANQNYDDQYRTDYDYDANGNLLLLERFKEDGVQMDNLTYLYYEKDANGNFVDDSYDPNDLSTVSSGNTISNRLYSVNDNEPSTIALSKPGELVGIHKYEYDEIGNLVFEDAKEWMNLDNITDPELYDVKTTITWTVYGKVATVHKESAKTSTGSIYQVSDINFAYDASGNRIRKTVSTKSSSTGGLSSTPTYASFETKITYYVRDAQGNTLAVYEDTQNEPGEYRKLDLIEQPIYGSDRLGQNTKKENIATGIDVDAPIGLPPTGLQNIAEYQNWIVSANGKLNSGLNDICNTKIDLINFDKISNNDYSATTNNEFLGIAKNGVAMAENTQGQLQFYTVLTEKYLGNADACLVYDAEGKLMKGTEYITGINTKSKPVIVQLPNTNKYALVTLNNNNKPEYHVVDMSLLGYGPLLNAGLANAGEILQTAVGSPLAAGATQSYGLHFTGLEDHVNGKTIVYTTRFSELTPQGDGMTEIVAYEFTSANAAPQEHVLYSLNSCADTKQGEIQLSKDGTKLLWYHHNEYVSGFDHRVADIYEIELEASKTAITGNVNMINASQAGNYGNGNIEGDENGDILYSQRGIYKELYSNSTTTASEKHIWKYSPLTSINMGNVSPLDPTTSYLFSEIKRGPDGVLYLPTMGEQATQIKTWNGTTTAFKNLTAGSEYQLTGSLPTQVYKLFATDAVGISAGRNVGNKQYELKDHLGNVRVVISDEKLLAQTIGVGDATLIDAGDYFTPKVVSFSDYYPFGSPMRKYNFTEMNVGFNGKRMDNEISVEGGHMDFGARIYDSRVPHFLNMDPKTHEYPWITPYSYAANNPIAYIDGNGEHPIFWLIALFFAATTPNPAVAPTGRPTDAQAVKDAYNFAGFWTTAGLLAPAAPALGEFAVTQVGQIPAAFTALATTGTALYTNPNTPAIVEQITATAWGLFLDEEYPGASVNDNVTKTLRKSFFKLSEFPDEIKGLVKKLDDISKKYKGPISTKTQQAKLLEINNAIGNFGEKAVLKKLKEIFPDSEIVTQLKGVSEDGTEFFIDFAIKDRAGDIVRVVEVKTGAASLSKGQQALFNTASEVAGNNKNVIKGKELTDVPKTVIRVTFEGQ